MNEKTKKAWLITWNGNHAEVDDQDRVVSILNYRLSGETVRKITEQLYVDSLYCLSERLSYAKSARNYPYPAKFADIKGVPYQGKIDCGPNPFLYARLVDDLQVKEDEDGKEKHSWKEKPMPKDLKD